MLFKRLCAIILLFAILFAILLFLVGCGKREPIQVNISDNDELFSDHFGEFIKINDRLRYDSATGIVYIFIRNGRWLIYAILCSKWASI